MEDYNDLKNNIPRVVANAINAFSIKELTHAYSLLEETEGINRSKILTKIAELLAEIKVPNGRSNT